MIIEAIITLISAVFKVLFAWINLPQAPEEIQSAINTYLDLIFDNLQFVGFFIRPATLKVVAITSISLYVFSRLYKVTMWIYHKLPISSN